MARGLRVVSVGLRLGVRAKLYLITGLVFGGMAFTIAANLYTVRTVKVGGALYARIRDRQEALERLAQLRADLNQVRAELAILAGETDPDRVQLFKGSL